MKQALQRHAAQATKASKVSPLPAAQTAPTAAPAARSWSAPDPGVFAAQKPIQAPVAKRDTLDSRMVAELTKIASRSYQPV